MDTSPLPELTRSDEPDSIVPAWHIPVTQFPINASRSRVKVLGYRTRRSPYRKGFLLLQEEGIHLDGDTVMPNNRWYELSVNCCCLWCVPVIGLYFVHSGLLFTLLIMGLVVILAGIPIFSLMAEYLRGRDEETIPWEDVVELWCDSKMRFALLIYRHKGSGGLPYALDLSFTEEHQVVQLKQGVEHFGVRTAHFEVSEKPWTTTEMAIGVIISLVALILLIAGIFYFCLS